MRWVVLHWRQLFGWAFFIVIVGGPILGLTLGTLERRRAKRSLDVATKRHAQILEKLDVLIAKVGARNGAD